MPETEPIEDELAADDLGTSRPAFDLAAALEALPEDLQLSDDVDLDTDDPALDEEAGKRKCVAVRRAGGRCTAPPMHTGLLCTLHAGALDPATGTAASALARRNRGVSEEEIARQVRMGARSVIAEELHSDPVQLRLVIRTLRGMAASGDVGAAKALIPFLNQGLGMPTETVRVEAPTGEDDVRAMPQAQLLELVARSRQRRIATQDSATPVVESETA